MQGHPSQKRFLLALTSLFFIVPAGFYTKCYTGPAAGWVRNSLGGVFYEIFWCLVIFLASSRPRPWAIASVVLACTCALEFLQLWHPPLLEAARANLIGRTVLGTSFTWSDFPYYFAGSALGWLWIRALLRQPGRSSGPSRSCSSGP